MRCEFSGEGLKNRFFFVLNLSPQNDNDLVIVTATTKIKGREACRRPEVLVKLSRKEYHELDADSVIDCESAEPWPKATLLKSIGGKNVQPLSPLPPPVMRRIADAVLACKTLSTVTKRMVLGSN